MNPAEQRASEVARESYGRLVALLASRTRDIAAVEDALSDAFEAALTQWARNGVPQNPEAWLLTAAKRRLLDGHRREAVRAKASEHLLLRMDEVMSEERDAVFPDERLRMLFVCTHPAIDPEARVPLMLQTVLGLDAATVANAMRVAPKTMGQRMWRAKEKIYEAHVSFDVPSKETLAERLESVLDAIYVAFGVSWEDVCGIDVRMRDLTKEALFLGHLVVKLLPNEPEALGLLALMLFAEARFPARRSSSGAYVPLSKQDVALWSRPLIREAELALTQAASFGSVGRFQLEAAIQSAHVNGRIEGQVDTRSIADLYDGLMHVAPSLGGWVAHASAILDADGAPEAIAALDGIEDARKTSYQPYWAVRAAALRAAGERALADEAYDRAIALSEDATVRDFLHEERLKISRAR